MLNCTKSTEGMKVNEEINSKYHFASHSLSKTSFMGVVGKISLLFKIFSLCVSFFFFSSCYTDIIWKFLGQGLHPRQQIPATSVTHATTYHNAECLTALSEARDGTCILIDTTLVLNPLNHNGNSSLCVLCPSPKPRTLLSCLFLCLSLTTSLSQFLISPICTEVNDRN